MADQTTQPQKTWLGRLIQKVGNWFTNEAKPIVHDIVVIADNVGNKLKASEASPTGLLHLFEVALPMVIPASTGLINAFQFELNKIVTDLNWAKAESGKTGDQIVQDGLTYLKSLKGTDDYAIQMHAFAAKTQKWFSDNLQAGLTIQQALTTPSIVHDPTLSLIANEIIKDVQGVSQVADAVADTTQEIIDANKPADEAPQ